MQHEQLTERLLLLAIPLPFKLPPCFGIQSPSQFIVSQSQHCLIDGKNGGMKTTTEQFLAQIHLSSQVSMEGIPDPARPSTTFSNEYGTPRLNYTEMH